MMSSFVHNVSKLGPLMGDLVVSAAGCFVFTRGFRLVATQEDGSGKGAPMRASDPPYKPFAGIGAALFLLVFVVSEALVMLGAIRH